MKHRQALPPWLKQRIPASPALDATAKLVRKFRLNTVCQSARCPNLGVCFSSGTATFMIMGTICTRRCTFCAVDKGSPLPPEHDEPARLADAIRAMELTHAVLTSVTRDDLPDGGAAHFARCVRAIRTTSPNTTIEVLIPDFSGSQSALATVLDSNPDVLNHNIETVPRLYELARPGASYRRSMDLIGAASHAGALTKSGLMLGLGETHDELTHVMRDLRRHGCEILTLGQYLPPTTDHIPLERTVTPEEFERCHTQAIGMGFRAAACGPLVRSSYLAAELCEEVLSCRI